jgi:hypothetical protein
MLRAAFAIDKKESSKLSNDLTPCFLFAEFTYKAKGTERRCTFKERQKLCNNQKILLQQQQHRQISNPSF